MRYLFEGGYNDTQDLVAGSYHSKAATIRGWCLIEEIFYIRRGGKGRERRGGGGGGVEGTMEYSRCLNFSM